MDTLSYCNRRSLRVIGSGDAGTVLLVRIVGGDIDVLRYDSGGGECVVERRVHVPRVREHWNMGPWCFLDRSDEAAAHGSIALCDILCDPEFICKFAADVKNLKLGRVKRRFDRSFPYELPWTISMCL
ncbi:unnamed protein product [Urochloa humidicola]